MSEKDVVYALQMLHVIQSKKNAIAFVEYLDKKNSIFCLLSKGEQEKIYNEFTLQEFRKEQNENIDSSIFKK